MHDPRDAARDAEIACAFVASAVERKVGRTSRQGRMVPPLACRSASAVIRQFAEERLYKVPLSAARALLIWADGFPVERLESIPEPRRVLALQAEGRRCVSLLPDGVSPAPHEDALAFALHDLCHLSKFIDPEHYAGQVGFSALVHRAMQRAAWDELVALFDAAFVEDLHHVIADMNGSSIFLFAALKMKLKMAVRRRSARLAGAPAPEAGPLSPEEAASYEIHLDELLRLFDLDRRLNDAAKRVSTRRDNPDAARELWCFFCGIGREILARLWGSALGPISVWHIGRPVSNLPRKADDAKWY
jgi:hypothetical protein